MISNMSNASRATLKRRALYGGRKGRRASHRLRGTSWLMVYVANSVEVYVGGLRLDVVEPIELVS